MIAVRDEIKKYFDSVIEYKRNLEKAICDLTTPKDKIKQYKKELTLIPTEFYVYIKNETHIGLLKYCDGCYIVPTTFKSFQKVCAKYDHAGFKFIGVRYITEEDFKRGFVSW